MRGGVEVANARVERGAHDRDRLVIGDACIEISERRGAQGDRAEHLG